MLFWSVSDSWWTVLAARSGPQWRRMSSVISDRMEMPPGTGIRPSSMRKSSRVGSGWRGEGGGGGEKIVGGEGGGGPRGRGEHPPWPEEGGGGGGPGGGPRPRRRRR